MADKTHLQKLDEIERLKEQEKALEAKLEGRFLTKKRRAELTEELDQTRYALAGAKEREQYDASDTQKAAWAKEDREKQLQIDAAAERARFDALQEELEARRREKAARDLENESAPTMSRDRGWGR